MWRVGSRAHDRFGNQRKERVFEASGDLPRAPMQLVERAFRYQPPLGNDADAVGHALGDLENMCRHDDGGAGGTVIMTTHILEVAERMADRIGVIAGGRLIAQGTLDDLRRQTGNSTTSLEDTFLTLVADEAA